jgi:hypothetical protein
MRTEALLVKVREHLAMARFDHGHFLEHLGRARIAVMKILCEGHIDAIVIFLGGDRQGEDLAFAQFFKTFHAGTPRMALAIVLTKTNCLRFSCKNHRFAWLELGCAIPPAHWKGAGKQGAFQTPTPQRDSSNLKKAAAALRDASVLSQTIESLV